MEGFIMIPRALFESEAWVNGSESQKVFIMELYSRVAYSEHEQKLKSGSVNVQKGQLAISLRDFADDLGYSLAKLRRTIEYFKKMA